MLNRSIENKYSYNEGIVLHISFTRVLIVISTIVLLFFGPIYVSQNKDQLLSYLFEKETPYTVYALQERVNPEQVNTVGQVAGISTSKQNYSTTASIMIPIVQKDLQINANSIPLFIIGTALLTIAFALSFYLLLHKE